MSLAWIKDQAVQNQILDRLLRKSDIYLPNSSWNFFNFYAIFIVNLIKRLVGV